MITDEQLDVFRQNGNSVRAIRDEMEVNDVIGIVVAWDDSHVVLRRPNRRVVKLHRSYRYIDASQDRSI